MHKTMAMMLIILASIASPADIQGYLTSSIYSFNREDREQSSVNHLRFYESFYIQGKNIGLKSSRLSLSGIIYTDPLNSFHNDPVFRMYTAAYRFPLISPALQVGMGRQFVTSIATSGRLDGAAVYWSGSHLNIQGFGGAYVPATGWTGDPASDYLAGADVRWKTDHKLNLGVSISTKNHSREVYRSTITNKDIEVPSTIANRLAYQMEYFPGNYQIYIGARHKLSDLSLNELTLVGSTEFAGIRDLRFEYNFREPRIPENSIFSVFDASSTQEFRISGLREINHSISGNFNLRHVSFDHSHADILSFGLLLSNLQAVYVFQTGYGGSTNRLQLTGQKKIGLFDMYGRVVIGRYKLLEGTWNDLATCTAGTRMTFWKRFDLKSEIQFLRNQYYDKDVRFLCTLMMRIK